LIFPARASRAQGFSKNFISAENRFIKKIYCLNIEYQKILEKTSSLKFRKI